MSSGSLAVALIGSLGLAQEAPRVVKDPRARPLLVEDALLVIEDVSGPIQAVGDVNGDGVCDLAIERGGERLLVGPRRSKPASRVDLVSGFDGSTIRTLSELPRDEYRTLHTSARLRSGWDARGDANADGVPDLVVGRWRDGEERRGEVQLVSGADGATLWRIEGDEPFDGLGFAVAFVGDVDGDGHDDVALGAPQAKEEEPIVDRRAVASMSTYESVGLRAKTTVHLHGGDELPFEDWLRDGLERRSESPGYVSVRSGADGSELVRFTGERAGHGFGHRVVAAGDYDGDARPELLLASAPESRLPVRLVSAVTGAELTRIEHLGGPLGPLGDVMGGNVTPGGAPEIFQSELNLDRDRHLTHVRVMTVPPHVEGQALEGMRFETLVKLKYPDWASKHTVVAGVGDLDGDGHADIAIGEPNFNIPCEGQREPGLFFADVYTATLAEAVRSESAGRISMMCEGGTAWIYSGRTHRPIWGVFAEPGERLGLGHEVLRVPDRTGDGYPDLVVAGHARAYVFPGPGAERD